MLRSKDKGALFPEFSAQAVLEVFSLFVPDAKCCARVCLILFPRIINVFHASLVAVPIFLHSNYAVDALRGTMHKRDTQKIDC